MWRPTENKEVVSRFAESDDEEFERETWRVQSMMRGSLSDIYDIAWSPDGRFIISGSIDNTARIWDVRDGKEFELGYCSWSGHMILTRTIMKRSFLEAKLTIIVN